MQEAVFLGNCVHVLACLGSGETVVAEIARDGGSYQAGEAVHVCWSPSDEMIFPELSATVSPRVFGFR